MHQEDLWAAGYVRMGADGEDKLVVFTVKVIKMVAPDVLDVPWIDVAVGVGMGLDEHHRRKIVDVPVAWNFDESGRLTCFERLHPSVGVLLIVNLVPLVARSQVVNLTVVVGQAVVVLDSVIEQQICAFLACLPPRDEMDEIRHIGLNGDRDG